MQAISLYKCPWNSRVVAYLLVVVATVFYIVTIRPGHDWGGDFALYIAHAKNLAMGLPYADTGFVYNELEPFLSPRSYPPVFPLYLTPVYKIFGLNIWALKVAVILSFFVFLILFYEYAHKRLDTVWMQLATLAVVAFAPWFWEAKDRILPDFLFMLFLYGSFILIDKISNVRQAGLRQYLTAAGVGMVIYLTYGTRSLGVLIIPALLFHDILRRRVVSFTTLIAVLVFTVFYFTQNTFLHTDKSYIQSIKTYAFMQGDLSDLDGLKSGMGEVHGAAADPAREYYTSGKLLAIIKKTISAIQNQTTVNLYFYSQSISSYWYAGESKLPARILFLAFTLLAIAGFVNMIIKAPSMSDYFILVYIFILLVVPFQQQRYMMPLLPIYVMYIFRGTEVIQKTLIARCSSMWSKFARALPVIVCGAIMGSYVISYSMSTAEDIERGVESFESRQLFEFIRQETPKDSLFVFHKPRPLALFTDRRAVKYHWDISADALWSALMSMGVTHIVLPKYITATWHRQTFLPMLDSYKDALATVFENRDYVVYLVADRDTR